MPARVQHATRDHAKAHIAQLRQAVRVRRAGWLRLRDTVPYLGVSQDRQQVRVLPVEASVPIRIQPVTPSNDEGGYGSAGGDDGGSQRSD